jgi:hypothetical protein
MFLFLFLKTSNETVEDPQKGSTHIDDFVLCDSMIDNKIFNSFLLLPIQLSGIVSCILVIL